MFHGFGSGVPSSSARQTCVTWKGPSQRGGGGEELRGRACVGLLGKVCVRAPDRPPRAAYYAQIAGDSAGAPDGTVHFTELLAILFCRLGRHHHTGAGPMWLRRMPGHEGRPW
jgi:hypothetical protein